MRQQNKNFDITNIVMGVDQLAGAVGKGRDALSKKAVKSKGDDGKVTSKKAFKKDVRDNKAKLRAEGKSRKEVRQETRAMKNSVQYGYYKKDGQTFRAPSNWSLMGKLNGAINGAFNKLGTRGDRRNRVRTEDANKKYEMDQRQIKMKEEMNNTRETVLKGKSWVGRVLFSVGVGKNADGKRRHQWKKEIKVKVKNDFETVKKNKIDDYKKNNPEYQILEQEYKLLEKSLSDGTPSGSTKTTDLKSPYSSYNPWQTEPKTTTATSVPKPSGKYSIIVKNDNKVQGDKIQDKKAIQDRMGEIKKKMDGYTRLLTIDKNGNLVRTVDYTALWEQFKELKQQLKEARHSRAEKRRLKEEYNKLDKILRAGPPIDKTVQPEGTEINLNRQPYDWTQTGTPATTKKIMPAYSDKWNIEVQDNKTITADRKDELGSRILQLDVKTLRAEKRAAALSLVNGVRKTENMSDGAIKMREELERKKNELKAKESEIVSTNDKTEKANLIQEREKLKIEIERLNNRIANIGIDTKSSFIAGTIAMLKNKLDGSPETEDVKPETGVKDNSLQPQSWSMWEKPAAVYSFSSKPTLADFKEHLALGSLPMPTNENMTKIMNLKNGEGMDLKFDGVAYRIEMKDKKLNMYPAGVGIVTTTVSNDLQKKISGLEKLDNMSWAEKNALVNLLRKSDIGLDPKIIIRLKNSLNSGNTEQFAKIIYENNLLDGVTMKKGIGRLDEVKSFDALAKTATTNAMAQGSQTWRRLEQGSVGALFSAPNLISALLIWKIKPWQGENEDLANSVWQQLKKDFRVDVSSWQEAVKTAVRLIERANELLIYTKTAGALGKALNAGGKSTIAGNVFGEIGNFGNAPGLKQLDYVSRIEVGNIGPSHTWTVGELSTLFNPKGSSALSISLPLVSSILVQPIIGAVSETMKVRLSKEQEETGIVREYEVDGEKYRVMADNGKVYDASGKLVDVREGGALNGLGEKLQSAWERGDEFKSHYCTVDSSGTIYEVTKGKYGRILARTADYHEAQIMLETRMFAMLSRNYTMSLKDAKDLNEMHVNAEDVYRYEQWFSELDRRERLGKKALDESDIEALAPLLAKFGIAGKDKNGKGYLVELNDGIATEKGIEQAKNIVNELGIVDVAGKLEHYARIYKTAANSDSLWMITQATKIAMENHQRQLNELNSMREHLNDFDLAQKAHSNYDFYSYVASEANNIGFIAAASSNMLLKDPLMEYMNDPAATALRESAEDFQKSGLGAKNGANYILTIALGNLGMLETFASLHNVAGEGNAQEKNISLITDMYQRNSHDLLKGNAIGVLGSMDTIDSWTNVAYSVIELANNKDPFNGTLQNCSKMLSEDARKGTEMLIGEMTDGQIECMNKALESGLRVRESGLAEDKTKYESDLDKFKFFNTQTRIATTWIVEEAMSESTKIDGQKEIARAIMKLTEGEEFFEKRYRNERIMEKKMEEFNTLSGLEKGEKFEFDINKRKIDVLDKNGEMKEYTVEEIMNDKFNDPALLKSAMVSTQIDYMKSILGRMEVHDFTGSVNARSVEIARKQIEKELDIVMDDYEKAMEKKGGARLDDLDTIYRALYGCNTQNNELEKAAYNTSDLAVEKGLYGSGSDWASPNQPTYLNDPGRAELEKITKKEMAFAHSFGSAEIFMHAVLKPLGINVGYGGINDAPMEYGEYKQQVRQQSHEEEKELMEKASPIGYDLKERMQLAQSVDLSNRKNELVEKNENLQVDSWMKTFGKYDRQNENSTFNYIMDLKEFGQETQLKTVQSAVDQMLEAEKPLATEDQASVFLTKQLRWNEKEGVYDMVRGVEGGFDENQLIAFKLSHRTITIRDPAPDDNVFSKNLFKGFDVGNGNENERAAKLVELAKTPEGTKRLVDNQDVEFEKKTMDNTDRDWTARAMKAILKKKI